jgi:hypothetical protein
LLKKPEGERPLEDLGVDGKNITINFQVTWWHQMYWIHLVPGTYTWCGSSPHWTTWFHKVLCWGNIRFWRRTLLYGASSCDTQFQTIQAFELRAECNSKITVERFLHDCLTYELSRSVLWIE